MNRIESYHWGKLLFRSFLTLMNHFILTGTISTHIKLKLVSVQSGLEKLGKYTRTRYVIDTGVSRLLTACISYENKPTSFVEDIAQEEQAFLSHLSREPTDIFCWSTTHSSSKVTCNCFIVSNINPTNLLLKPSRITLKMKQSAVNLISQWPTLSIPDRM